MRACARVCVCVCVAERRLEVGGRDRSGQLPVYMGDPYSRTAIASTESLIWFPKSLGCKAGAQVVLWLEKMLFEL